MKLLKISLRIWIGNVSEYKLRVLELSSARKTGKSYLFDGKRVSFDKLGKIDTNHIEGSTKITEYFTYCLPEDELECIQLLKRKIEEEVCRKHSEMQLHKDVLNKGFVVERKICE